ncbi:cyclic nucleotide-binding domain-containing protein [bacterium]|nr:cyclic nucleotide-binding domain-containing protein [bacterium]
MSNKNFLQNIKLFSELSLDELGIVSNSLKLVTFRAGETIFEEDSAGNELFLLFEGEVCISKKTSFIDNQSDINKTLITLHSKDFPFFGEVGLLGKQLRTATAKAITDCKLYSINHDQFVKIIKEHHHIGVVVLWEISQKLAQILEKTDSDILKLTTALIYALR